MRSILLLVACVFVSGCLGFGKKEKVEPVAAAPVTTNECYTVDLFTKVNVEQPAADVPDQFRQFLGSWGGGAWNEVWCHELLISKIEKDGRVEFVDMHAPYEPWAQPATAFRRVGRIDDKGALRFAYGTERISYRIENGKLIGDRSGTLGNLHVELYRLSVPPLPVPKPIRVAQATAAPGG
jgi:hypothetical protein